MHTNFLPSVLHSHSTLIGFYQKSFLLCTQSISADIFLFFCTCNLISSFLINHRNAHKSQTLNYTFKFICDNSDIFHSIIGWKQIQLRRHSISCFLLTNVFLGKSYIPDTLNSVLLLFLDFPWYLYEFPTVVPIFLYLSVCWCLCRLFSSLRPSSSLHWSLIRFCPQIHYSNYSSTRHIYIFSLRSSTSLTS